MSPPRVLIVSPALASANNGNWQTAWRWSQMLRPHCATTIAQDWKGEPFDVLLALHARRSAISIARWAQDRGVSADAPGLGVVLTGTDLYHDIQTDAQAQASLVYAQRLVVLQERGPDALPAALRDKARVVFQSTSPQPTLDKTPRQLRAVMVGHLRDEKSPQTLFAAARLLQDHADLFIDHIGDALDADLGDQAQACAAACPHYRWLGGLAHAATLRAIQRAHVLVHASRLEGGAHVVMEAVCSGTPVLASRIDGNVGMLGADYAGYFEPGDAQGLADLLLRCRADQRQSGALKSTPGRPKLTCTPSGGQPQGWAGGDLYRQLQAQCALRAPLFAPAREQAALRELVRELQGCHT